MLWCGCKGRRDQLVEGLIMELPPDLIDNDLGETPDSREKALVELKEELKKCSIEELDGFDQSDVNLVRFLRGKKYNQAKTLKVIKNRVKFHKDHSDLVKDASVEEFERLGRIVTLLPNRAADGKVCVLLTPKLIIETLEDTQFMKANQLIVARFMIWFFNSLSQDIYVQTCGVVLILSMRDITLFEAMTFIGAAKNEDRALAISYFTSCTAARFGGMLAFDHPMIVKPIFFIVTLFLPQKLKDRMHLCGTDYQRAQEILGNDISKIPTCLGGSLEEKDCIYYVIQKLELPRAKVTTTQR